VLYREPKLLKVETQHPALAALRVVSVLCREPKLLKAKREKDFHFYRFVFQCSTVSRNC
jgi:hypothetical protein